MADFRSIGMDEVAAVHSRSTALYHSLGHIIRAKIQSGEWAAGQQIPSERELMKIFNLSRATVRQGIDYLVREGVLIRAQGKGTFVAPPKVEQGLLRLLEFSDVLRQNGLRPSLQVVGKERVTPPGNVQKLLSLLSGEQAAWFQCVLAVNEQPVLIETSYFSASRFPDLFETYDGKEEPYPFVVRRYGIQVARARETFEPVILEEAEAALLGTRRGVPALWVEHMVYEAPLKPLALITSLLRGDRCRFYTELVLDRN